ncbi:hypothetical protein OsJ_32139 [Oryza sativa Japonica Group]|uniref:Uncharacterized protein n=1 Tax=Oryza sativa subsp. japonica TaxID=39947 RepID=A3C6F1_ORYSJ|nr:hypothetical protein OsJ_32139 [Oryza sativa Japonica Group]
MADMVKFTMEWLQDPLSLAIVVTVAVLIMRMQRRRAAPFPPGPKPLPIVGNMAMMDQLTHRGLAALAKEYGGLMHLRLGRLHAFARVDAGVRARAGAAPRRGSPCATSPRRSCAPVAASRGEAAVNLGELIFNLTKNVIFRAAFGTRDGEGHDEFIAILQEFSKLFGAFNIGDFIPWLSWADTNGINARLVAARTALDRFIDKIIDEHMERGKNPDDADADMVDDMLAFLAEAKPHAGKAAAAAAGAGDGADDLQNTLRLTRDNIKAIIMVNRYDQPLDGATYASWIID